jgi:D-glycero-alpha-D-manno-heptose 1-phosphate guanylyltransferase
MTTAIILAGGLGTRLRSVVADLPKPMAPVAGRPFLEHLLDYWIAQGVTRFVLSVGYLRHSIETHFGSRYRGIPIAYSIEIEPLGTGGALLAALGHLVTERDFLLLNGDTYFAVSLSELSRFARGQCADWCFSLFPTADTRRYLGLTVDQSGRILELGSQASTDAILANGGAYWVTRENIDKLGFATGQQYSLEADILPAALRAGQRIVGLPCVGAFIDIGIPVDYQRAQHLFESHATH